MGNRPPLREGLDASLHDAAMDAASRLAKRCNPGTDESIRLCSLLALSLLLSLLSRTLQRVVAGCLTPRSIACAPATYPRLLSNPPLARRRLPKRDPYQHRETRASRASFHTFRHSSFNGILLRTSGYLTLIRDSRAIHIATVAFQSLIATHVHCDQKPPRLNRRPSQAAYKSRNRVLNCSNILSVFALNHRIKTPALCLSSWARSAVLETCYVFALSI